MHLKLGSEFNNFIQGQVDSGLYGNATEVIRDALRHMKDRQENKRLETICIDTIAGPPATKKSFLYHILTFR